MVPASRLAKKKASAHVRERQGKLPSSFSLAILERGHAGSGENIRTLFEEQPDHAHCSSRSEEKWQSLLGARGRMNVKFCGKQLEISQ